METKTTIAQKTGRWILGIFLAGAGIGHLTFLRREFQAQVPRWVPLDPDLVVVLSGIVEIILGSALLLLPKYRTQVGWLTALFFVLIFPGNIAQLTEHRKAFGLDSNFALWARLPFQPVLILVALWSTGAWHQWRKSRKSLRN